MEKYLEVEQVGFLSNETNRLEMAGGEFCMNATRCAVYEYSKENEDSIEMLELIQPSGYTVNIELDTKKQYIENIIITGIVEEV